MANKLNKPSYRDLKNELDQIMLGLAQEDLDIDEVLKMYDRGLELVKQTEAYLLQAKNKVNKLKNNKAK